MNRADGYLRTVEIAPHPKLFLHPLRGKSLSGSGVGKMGSFYGNNQEKILLLVCPDGLVC